MGALSGLNIDLLRAPLKSAERMILADQSPEGAEIILPGSDAEVVAVSQSRLDILRESSLHFPQQMGELRTRLQRCLREGVHPVDAIYLGVEFALETCIMTTPDSQVMRNAEAIFEATRTNEKAVKGIQSAREELALLARHGLRVLIGLIENAPAVYEKTYEEAPDKAKLHDLIPASTEPLMSVISGGPGGYALLIERVLGMKGRKFVAESRLNNRLVFETEFLEIKEVDRQPIVDMKDGIAETIVRLTEGNLAGYHGCLADLVEMPEEKGQGAHGKKVASMFTFMTQLVSSLMHEYWIPYLLKKRP